MRVTLAVLGVVAVVATFAAVAQWRSGSQFGAASEHLLDHDDDVNRFGAATVKRRLDVSVQNSGNEKSATVEARAEDETRAKVRFQFEFKLDGFPRFRARYRSKSSGDLPTSEAFTFRFGLRRMFEFFPSSGTCYSNGDRVLSERRLVGVSGGDRNVMRNRWSDIVKTTTVTNNITWHELSTTYTNAPLSVQLKVQVAEALFKTNSNVTLTPNGVKVWIQVNGYQFVNTSSTLGLEIVAQSKSSFRSYSSSAITVGNNQGQYVWEKSMIKDGQVVTVSNSNPANDDNITEVQNEVETGDDGESCNRYVYCVPGGGSSYLWDPTVQLADGASSPAFAARPAVSLLVLLALALVAWLA